MSTEAISIDDAVNQLVGEEPVQETVSEVTEDVTIEESDVLEESNADVETEDDSEVDYSDEEYSDEDDTDEESVEYDDEPDESGPETITVKVDGEEVSVTLDDLKRSYSGQGKIQKGMQEAAEARKQAEEMKQQAIQAMTQLNAMYERAQQSGFKAPPQAPDRELFNSDPIKYLEMKEQYEADLQEFQVEQQQMMRMRQAQQQQMTQAQQAQLAQQAEMLREKMPEMADPEKADKIRSDLAKTGMEFGYTEDELSGITDHRALLVLRDAMRWRNAQKSKSAVEKKANQARKVIKPQAKKTQDPSRKKIREQKAKLKRTGSIDDALNFVLN